MWSVTVCIINTWLAYVYKSNYFWPHLFYHADMSQLFPTRDFYNVVIKISTNRIWSYHGRREGGCRITNRPMNHISDILLFAIVNTFQNQVLNCFIKIFASRSQTIKSAYRNFRNSGGTWFKCCATYHGVTCGQVLGHVTVKNANELEVAIRLVQSLSPFEAVYLNFVVTFAQESDAMMQYLKCEKALDLPFIIIICTEKCLKARRGIYDLRIFFLLKI